MIQTQVIVETIFNQEAYSDLVLVVADRHFYCHRPIMALHSEYVQHMVVSPLVPDSSPKTTILIDLPPDSVDCFLTYLKVVYGLHYLRDAREIGAVAVIANFMMSPWVLGICDRLLQTLDPDPRPAAARAATTCPSRCSTAAASSGAAATSSAAVPSRCPGRAREHPRDGGGGDRRLPGRVLNCGSLHVRLSCWSYGED